MTYRELQAECKRLGLSAAGKKADLKARIKSEPKAADTSPAKKAPGKGFFVFTGDKVGGCDPAWCEMHGYSFKLDGAAVKVKDDVAAKLATHSHFTEQ